MHAPGNPAQDNDPEPKIPISLCKSYVVAVDGFDAKRISRVTREIGISRRTGKGTEAYSAILVINAHKNVVAGQERPLSPPFPW